MILRILLIDRFLKTNIFAKRTKKIPGCSLMESNWEKLSLPFVCQTLRQIYHKKGRKWHKSVTKALEGSVLLEGGGGGGLETQVQIKRGKSEDGGFICTGY